MFLNVLAVESRSKFLNLLHLAAKADGVASADELLHISAYASEMGIENSNDNPSSFEQIVEHFSVQAETIRKAIFVEITALAQVDQQFHQADADFISLLKEKLSLSDSFHKEAVEWIQKITPLYAQGFKLVGLT